MSRLMPETQGRYAPPPSQQWAQQPARRESGSLVPPLLIAGLVLGGLGALAWWYLGPDLRRYMKIRDM